MRTRKKPSIFTAGVFTAAAVGSLLTVLLMVTGTWASGGLIAFQLLTSALLTVAAIANWVVYFGKRLDFELANQQTGTTTEQ